MFNLALRSPKTRLYPQLLGCILSSWFLLRVEQIFISRLPPLPLCVNFKELLVSLHITPQYFFNLTLSRYFNFQRGLCPLGAGIAISWPVPHTVRSPPSAVVTEDAEFMGDKGHQEPEKDFVTNMN